MKVCVVGLGYIGLPTALMLAAHGVEVIGVDYNPSLVEALRTGRPTFEEKGLEQLFAKALEGGVQFSVDYPQADTYIIAVATPYNPQTKKVDPSFVTAATRSVLDICPRDALVVLESTVPPGTIDKEIRPLLAAAGRQDVQLAHAPERIIPGNMVQELEQNARTIGADHPKVAKRVADMYASFCKGQLVLTDIPTAEMTKVVENTYRDINIAFANELAKICHTGQMDVYEIIRIANLHPRVNILQPGPGVGGHCISVDPWFLVGDYPHEAKLTRAAREINDSMPGFVLGRIQEIMKAEGVESFAQVGLYGLTYKENVDDVRESPALQLLAVMKAQGITGVQAYDPYVKTTLVEGQHQALQAFLSACRLVVVLVGHNQLREAPGLLAGKLVLDTRHIPGLDWAHRLS